MIDPPDSPASSEYGDVAADNAEPAQPVAGPSRPRKNLYKDPTLDELDKLQSAQQSGGNTFSLQLDDLLSSTLLPRTPHSKLKDLLSGVHDLVMGLPSRKAIHPREVKKVDVPWVGPDEWSSLNGEVNWKVGWEKPSEVFVGGSWGVVGGYKKGKGESGGVDLVLMMPEVCRCPLYTRLLMVAI